MPTFRQFLSTVLLSSSLALLGCGSSEPAATAPAVAETPSPVVKSDGKSPYDVCVATFERQRTCQDTFIPALVDARVRADHPAGIAAADKSDGRDALVAAAFEEWKSDSTDEAIAATCRKVVEHAPAGMADEAEACLAQSDCASFSTCAIDLVASQWR